MAVIAVVRGRRVCGADLSGVPVRLYGSCDALCVSLGLGCAGVRRVVCDLARLRYLRVLFVHGDATRVNWTVPVCVASCGSHELAQRWCADDVRNVAFVVSHLDLAWSVQSVCAVELIDCVSSRSLRRPCCAWRGFRVDNVCGLILGGDIVCVLSRVAARCGRGGSLATVYGTLSLRGAPRGGVTFSGVIDVDALMCFVCNDLRVGVAVSLCVGVVVVSCALGRRCSVGARGLLPCAVRERFSRNDVDVIQHADGADSHCHVRVRGLSALASRVLPALCLCCAFGPELTGCEFVVTVTVRGAFIVRVLRGAHRGWRFTRESTDLCAVCADVRVGGSAATLLRACSILRACFDVLC